MVLFSLDSRSHRKLSPLLTTEMMAFAAICARSTCCNHFRPIPPPLTHPRIPTVARAPSFLFLRLTRLRRLLGTSAESAVPPPEFEGGENAYEVLGVSETCSYDEIKFSFRKLAKETHPDLAYSENGCNSDNASKRFVQILAAYEILSDPSKRADYDQYLLTQRHIVQKRLRRESDYHMYATYMGSNKQMEVVEWLKWYRYAVKDILQETRVVDGAGYFDVLQQNFYSAVRAAYYGPEVEAIDLLPDRFEAEERSVCDTLEVLHLVSGRDLFGVVCITEKIPQLSEVCYKTLSSSGSMDIDSYRLAHNEKVQEDTAGRTSAQMTELDAYKNLELHVFGRLVATATRIPPKCCPNQIEDEDSLDQIHIFLTSDEYPIHRDCNSNGNYLDRASSEIPLGKITGLGTTSEESSCYVYNSFGTKTHVILKHRTLLVKHMHWFQLGDEVSICECRCTRARLPPSKFWLFEPRCGTHDIGGWYVETFGRDKRSQTIPSQRYWDGIDAGQKIEKRLHPAMYLLALAYRTLDMEIARRRKQTIRDIVRGGLFKMSSWCKRL